jgi:hypothetical protein
MIYSQAYLSVEICRRLGIDLKGKTSGKVMTSHDGHGVKSPCMNVDIDRGLFHCFSCGEGGTLRTLYFEKTGRGILRDLGLKSDDVVYEPREEEPEPNFDDPPSTNFEFVGKTVPAESCRQGQLFLKKRGFDRSIAKKYSMKFVVSGITRSIDDPEDREYHINFKNRVIIPIYEKGRLISLEGRDPFGEERWREDIKAIGKDPDQMSYKKVLFPKLSSTNTLYGLSSLDRSKRVYVVEGLMDMIALRTCDEFRNSTAVFGASVTRRQIYLLDGFSEVCVVPDRDKAGTIMIKKLNDDDRIRRKLMVLPPPSGCKDVNDILLGRNPNVSSVTDAVSHGWLEKVVGVNEVNLNP